MMRLQGLRKPTDKSMFVPTIAGNKLTSAMGVELVKVKMRLSAEVPLEVRMDWRCSVVGASSSACRRDGSAPEGDEPFDGEEACGRGEAFVRMLATSAAKGKLRRDIVRRVD